MVRNLEMQWDLTDPKEKTSTWFNYDAEQEDIV